VRTVPVSTQEIEARVKRDANTIGRYTAGIVACGAAAAFAFNTGQGYVLAATAAGSIGFSVSLTMYMVERGKIPVTYDYADGDPEPVQAVSVPAAPTPQTARNEPRAAEFTAPREAMTARRTVSDTAAIRYSIRKLWLGHEGEWTHIPENVSLEDIEAVLKARGEGHLKSVSSRRLYQHAGLDRFADKTKNLIAFLDRVGLIEERGNSVYVFTDDGKRVFPHPSDPPRD
jgi:hypothetical protein